jgi:ATP-dependent RNA helicase DDX18/HAS1
LEKLIEKNYYLNRSAKDAYRSYLLAYTSHSLKDIFKVGSLDLLGVVKGFGFSIPPRVNLNISVTGRDGGEGGEDGGEGGRQKRRGGGGGLGDPIRRKMSDYVDPEKRAAAMKKLSHSSGHSFSASNPYGKRDVNDKRQFQR